jgi:hypothetical protein
LQFQSFGTLVKIRCRTRIDYLLISLQMSVTVIWIDRDPFTVNEIFYETVRCERSSPSMRWIAQHRLAPFVRVWWLLHRSSKRHRQVMVM